MNWPGGRWARRTDNAFIESFNGKFRLECVFFSVMEALEKTDESSEEYNPRRPHSRLGDVPTVEFTAQASASGFGCACTFS